MRTTQFIGLTAEAKKYIEDLKGREFTIHNNHTSGMFEEKIPLGSWLLDNGAVIREVVQCAPWSSGPCIFTCLVILSDKDPMNEVLHLWKEEDIYKLI